MRLCDDDHSFHLHKCVLISPKMEWVASFHYITGGNIRTLLKPTREMPLFYGI
jgi:hypothetical protein